MVDSKHDRLLVSEYAPADCVRTYAAFGGVPKYLSLIDTNESLDANIVGLVLSPNGGVRLQLETVLT